MVLVTLNAMFTLVFLKMFVILCTTGLWNVKVTHILDLGVGLAVCKEWNIIRNIAPDSGFPHRIIHNLRQKLTDKRTQTTYIIWCTQATNICSTE
jgi:hypothetical protein